MRRGLGLVLLVGLLGAAGPLAAQPAGPWAVLPFSARGVNPVAVETFAGLLRTELNQKLGAQIVPAAQNLPCPDAGCALAAGRASGARLAVFGQVSALGTKLIVNVAVVETGRGSILNSQRMAVMSVEELDAVATRIATAMAQGTTTNQAAELGTITSLEVKPERRREPARGTSMRVGAIVPLGANGYAGNPGGGVLFDLSYWFETKNFAIEPRVGVRFDGSSGVAEYVDVPLDLGAFYLFSTGDVAPFIGGGLGARYLWEKRPMTVTVGDVLPASADLVVKDSVWGFGAYARVGIMLLRTYTVRIALAGEYNVTIATINGFKNPQSLSMGASLIF